MGDALDELLALLELEALEVNLFRGLSPHEGVTYGRDGLAREASRR